MRLNIGSDDYNVYIANNVSMVQKMHQDHQVVTNNFTVILMYRYPKNTAAGPISGLLFFSNMKTFFRQHGFIAAFHGKPKR